MHAGRRTRKRRRPFKASKGTSAAAHRATNDVPPELIPFVNALAELIVSAYRRETPVRMTGDLPKVPKKQESEEF
jgi:hypothetical protein